MDVISIIVGMAITGLMAIMAVIPVITYSDDHNECDDLIIYEC